MDDGSSEKITITTQDKVNILLQGYVSRLPLDDFALISDSAYVAQNAGRIVRALLEIAVSRKWATVSAVLMGLSKAVEKRLWPFDQPLKQFDISDGSSYSWNTDIAGGTSIGLTLKDSTGKTVQSAPVTIQNSCE